MSADGHASNNLSPVTYVVDDAMDVKNYWFVAIVNHNSEKKSSEKLNDLSNENYLPTQTEFRVWKNGKKNKFERKITGWTKTIQIQKSGSPFHRCLSKTF